MEFQNNNVKNMCCFYASNWHLMVMIFTYLKKNNNTIIKTILEENIENDVEEFITKCNLNKDEKEKLLSINWNKSKIEEKLELNEFMNDILSSGKDVTIILKGSENEVIKNRIKINKWIKNLELSSINIPNINLVCCIDILKLTKSMNLIMQDYNYMLNTSGEHYIA